VHVGEANGDAPSYLAFVWPAGAQAPAVRRLGEATTIDARASDVLAAARSDAGEDEYRRVAGPTRSLVWDPVEPLLAGAREICVVPDGALVVLDLAALPTEASSYLIERTPPIQYLSAERDLLPPDDPPGRGMLACGGADFAHPPAAEATLEQLLAFAGPIEASTTTGPRGPSPATRLSGLEFRPLPKTAREVR